MIKMKKLNVVLEVPTEEKAGILEKQGFERVGGEPAPAADRFATMKDLQEATDAIYAHISETFQKMGEAMYERLHSALTAAQDKPKAAKASKKEEPHGGTDQPDSADSAK